MTKDLTVGSPLKVLFKFSLPAIGGNLFQLFYTLADSIIVGRTIGEDALAAVGSTTIFVYFILCFIQGSTTGFSILLGQYYGKKDGYGVKKRIATAYFLSFVFSIVITVASVLLTPFILDFLKVPSEIRSDASSYLLVILWGTWTTVFYNTVANTLRALGDSRTPLMYLVFSSLLNIVLDYVFIVPFGMGVSGAAWATVISQGLSFLLCHFSSVRKFEEMRIPRSYYIPEKLYVRRHFNIGFLMGFQMSVMCIGQLAMQSSVNALGTFAIAGYTAATKVDQLSVLVNNAFGTAIASYVAQNHGAGNVDRIRRGVNASLLIVEGSDVLMAILTFLFIPFVVPLFVTSASPEVYQYAREFFYVTLPFYPVLGLILIYRTTIQSMGNAIWPFVACIVELVARCVAAFVLSDFFGYKGTVFASPLAWIGADLIVVPAYYLIMHKRLKE